MKAKNQPIKRGVPETTVPSKPRGGGMEFSYLTSPFGKGLSLDKESTPKGIVITQANHAGE